jgi:flagellar hook-associated protein 1 FlgK
MALLPLLDIARSGLLAQELGISVTGNNIANVNTPGYTRQRAVLSEEIPGQQGSNVLIGRGVRTERVEQIVDPLLERRLRSVMTDQGEQAARRDRLTQLAEALNDVREPSLATQLDAFFDATDGLARNPAGLAERETLLGAASALAAELNRRAGQVATLQRGADDTLVQRVGEVSDQLGRIAQLNVQIASAELGGQTAGAMRDERTVALQEVAKALGVDVQEGADGSMRVLAKNGVVLVDAGTVLHRLAVRGGATGLDGQLLHDVGITDAAGGFVDTPSAVAPGEIAALRDVRDGAIATASARLDGFADALAAAVNGVQQDAAARDLDGLATAGVPFFTGSGADGIAVAITDPRRVAAARSTDAGDNANALALADLRTATQTGLGGLSPSGWLASEQARLGQQAAQATDVARSSDLLAEQVQTMRDAVSGVNLNEELTSMLRYQHAFQAAAKLVNVADAMLDTLVNLVR